MFQNTRLPQLIAAVTGSQLDYKGGKMTPLNGVLWWSV